jgi:tellurite resistance protein TehA-like permease
VRRFHERPWSGAFNVVMATAIVSIAMRQAGQQALSETLMWLAVFAFAPLALLDVGKARHPLAMLRRAGDPRYGFYALGFVADTAVLGSRISGHPLPRRVAEALLFACGALVWAAIAAALLRTRAGGTANRARGEWLLAVVATEGMAILAAKLGATGYGRPLRLAAVAIWATGICFYLIIAAELTIRLERRPLQPGMLTPDWWIVMGAPAITALAAATVHPTAGGAAAVVAMAGWALASFWIPFLVVGELWQAWRLGPPRFTPARWTTVFPLGMYSATSQLAGRTLGLGWMAELGRAWVWVAFAAWVAVASGELHHALAAGAPRRAL